MGEKGTKWKQKNIEKIFLWKLHLYINVKSCIWIIPFKNKGILKSFFFHKRFVVITWHSCAPLWGTVQYFNTCASTDWLNQARTSTFPFSVCSRHFLPSRWLTPSHKLLFSTVVSSYTVNSESHCFSLCSAGLLCTSACSRAYLAIFSGTFNLLWTQK